MRKRSHVLGGCFGGFSARSEHGSRSTGRRPGIESSSNAAAPRGLSHSYSTVKLPFIPESSWLGTEQNIS